MITIVLSGISYERDYQPRYCVLPGCGMRLQFRLNARGVPESSDKYNSRQTCCSKHARALRKLRRKSPAVSVTVDPWRKFVTMKR